MLTIFFIINIRKKWIFKKTYSENQTSHVECLHYYMKACFFKVTFSVDQTYAVEIPGIVADRSINFGLSVGRVNVAFVRTFTADETNYQDV